MMEFIHFGLGAGLILLIVVARRLMADFPAQRPEDYADDYTVLDMKQYLKGDMVCEGVIFGPTGRVSSSFIASFTVAWEGEVATINEHFVYDDNTTQDRVWTITLGDAGHFTATAPDVPTKAYGRQAGATVSIRYPIRLPADAGGHLLQAVDWMYLTADGTIMNRSQFRKFGIKVAELVATIRPKETS